MLTLYLVLRWRLLDVPLDRDEGVFGWIGQSIRRGELPYRDVFDHKPPGAFYLYALALTVIPATAAGVHAFLAVWNFASLLVTASLADALAGRRAALFTALVFAVVSAAPSVQGFATTTEMLLLLPAVGALRLVVTAARSQVARTRTLLLLSAGACAALAFAIRQTAAIALLPLPALIFLARPGAPWPTRLRSVALVVTGAVLVVGLIVAAFARDFDAFVYWTHTHNVIYSEESWRSVSGAAWRSDLALTVLALLPDLGLPVALGLVAAVLAWLADATVRPLGVALALVAAGLASALPAAFLYPHYFAQCVPAVALAGGLGLHALAERVGARAAAARPWFTAVAAVAVVSVPAMAHPAYWVVADPDRIILASAGPQGFEASALVAAYLRDHMREDEALYVHGSEPQLAFLAERRLANPFGMAYPMTGPFPRRDEFQRRVVAEIERTRPRYVVFCASQFTLMAPPGMELAPLVYLRPLLGAEYRVDAVLLFDKDHPHLVKGLSQSEFESLGARAFLTLWRRR